MKKNLHPGKLTLNVLNTSSTASPEFQAATDPSLQNLHSRPATVMEEIACAIAEAQAALFAGRIHDLEAAMVRQQNLCALLQGLQGKPLSLVPPSDNDRALAQTAQQVRQQNLVFGAALRRMRRHLDTLRNLLRGLSLTYEPARLRAPGREG